jgi:hypothetical protein
VRWEIQKTLYVEVAEGNTHKKEGSKPEKKEMLPPTEAYREFNSSKSRPNKQKT